MFFSLTLSLSLSLFESCLFSSFFLFQRVGGYFPHVWTVLNGWSCLKNILIFSPPPSARKKKVGFNNRRESSTSGGWFFFSFFVTPLLLPFFFLPSSSLHLLPPFFWVFSVFSVFSVFHSESSLLIFFFKFAFLPPSSSVFSPRD